MSQIETVSNKILELCDSNPNGITQDDMKNEIKADLKLIVEAINGLLQKRRINVFQAGDALLYKSVSEETSNVVKTLKPEEETIFKLIEQAGNVGIWQKTIKAKTKFQTKQINKITGDLIKKNLIKSVQTIQGKNKKVFMLASIEPSRDITGGIWYEGTELNSDLISSLQTEAYNFISAKKFSSTSSILDHIRMTGITQIELKEEDMQNVLNTLIYDGLIESVTTGKDLKYKPVQIDISENPFTQIPCSTCPVFEFCFDEGDINPKTCPYLKQWMEF